MKRRIMILNISNLKKVTVLPRVILTNSSLIMRLLPNLVMEDRQIMVGNRRDMEQHQVMVDNSRDMEHRQVMADNSRDMEDRHRPRIVTPHRHHHHHLHLQGLHLCMAEGGSNNLQPLTKRALQIINYCIRTETLRIKEPQRCKARNVFSNHKQIWK
jgi:hypothetical protein